MRQIRSKTTPAKSRQEIIEQARNMIDAYEAGLADGLICIMLRYDDDDDKRAGSIDTQVAAESRDDIQLMLQTVMSACDEGK